MEKKKKTFLPPFVLLCLVAIVMSAAISGVYTLTKDTIDAAAMAAQEEARRAVMTEAVSMTEIPLEEGAPVDYCYEAFDASGSSIGYISQITVMGFGGEIEVTVGMDRSGTITAIRVGGANFAETSGLGAKTRDAAFTDQFAGKSGMLILKQNIDSVTGASVSSSAVVGGVNRALTYMTGLLPAAPVSDVEEIELTAEELLTLVGGSGDTVTWMGGGEDIDGWWQLASGGYVVRATGFGLGPIVVTMAFDADGAVRAIIIGDENFMESAGYGARVQEEAYWSQFIGRSGQQAYGDSLDGISGASTTANATLEAINACMTFDPDDPGATAAEPVMENASEEPSQEPVTPDPDPPVAAVEGEAPADAATSASTIVLVTPEPTPEPDAATMASTIVVTPTPVPTPDAATTASTVVVTPAPTPEPTPDAATEASTIVVATPVVTPEPTPDAASMASTVVVTPVPTPATDAVTAASTVVVG